MVRIQSTSKKHRKNKGAILALVVMLVLLMSLGSMALVTVARESRIRTVKTSSDVAARLAADAGIERTIYTMNNDLQDSAWSADDTVSYSSELLTACNADYTVAFDGDLSSGYQITSVGKSGLATKTVRVTIELSNPFAEDFAVLTGGDLSMKAKSKIKGFNSGDASEKDVPASIGTMSTDKGSIDLGKDVVVNGDVYVGPGGDPDKVVKTTDKDAVAGEVFIMPTPVVYPDVSPPDYTASKGKISGDNITLTSSDSGKYSKLDISTKGKLEIDGDVVLYITGDVTLGNDADLKIKKGSSLKLYFDGDIEAKNSSSMSNESKIPADLQLYGTGKKQKIDMKNGSDIYGVIYAPDAELVVHNNVDMYGSFIVDNFEIKKGGDVYYDKALKETSLDDEAISFVVTKWEEL